MTYTFTSDNCPEGVQILYKDQINKEKHQLISINSNPQIEKGYSPLKKSPPGGNPFKDLPVIGSEALISTPKKYEDKHQLNKKKEIISKDTDLKKSDEKKSKEIPQKKDSAFKLIVKQKKSEDGSKVSTKSTTVYENIRTDLYGKEQANQYTLDDSSIDPMMLSSRKNKSCCNYSEACICIII